MFQLAIKSLKNRSFTTLLTIISIALSVTLLLGVERLKEETRNSFSQTVSGTDLIVGTRSNPIQLLLYSVFRIGYPTNHITFDSYDRISKSPKVKWSIPISLGDSHKGFRVLGTNMNYFEHYRYGPKRSLEVSKGEIFNDVFDAVLGADVAKTLGYEIGERIILSHGTGSTSLVTHDNTPFKVVGILKKTGTPVDRTIHIPLEGVEAIHYGWHNESSAHHDKHTPQMLLEKDLTPKKITAFFLGLNSRMAAFDLQRYINGYRKEPLTAIFPGFTLNELWQIMEILERTFFAISLMVIVVGLISMLIALMTTLNERRREMAILRSVGARPIHIFSLIVGESLILTLSGIILGTVFLYGGLLAFRPFIVTHLGIFVRITGISINEMILIGCVFFSGTLVGFVPGFQIYRFALKDGMSIRL